MSVIDILNSYFTYLWPVVDGIVTPITLLLGLFLFFNDPIRRWQFLGYRPSLMIILYDAKLGKVLVIKQTSWTFPQGSIYGSDIYTTLEQIIKRELNIESNSVRLKHILVLGTAKNPRSKDHRRTFGVFSIFNKLRGKGYIACFTETDFTNLKKSIRKGITIEEIRIVNYAKALDLIEGSYKTIGKTTKTKLIRIAFQELKKLTLQ